MIALCGALTLAEVATALPHTGGMYVFIREGWGRLPAFLFGWTKLVIIRAAALGAVATTFTEDGIRLFGYDPGTAPYRTYVHYIAALAIAALAGVNIVGLRWRSGILNVSAIAKYGALVFRAVVAFAAMPRAQPWNSPRRARARGSPVVRSGSPSWRSYGRTTGGPFCASLPAR